MQKYIILFSIYTLFFSNFIFAQQDAVWIFGRSQFMPNGDTCCFFNMKFVGDTFQLSPFVARNVEGGGAYQWGSGYTSSSICNDSGELLLYSNAKVICNAAGDTLLGGDSLAMTLDMWESTAPSSPFCTRTTHFIPKPGSSNSYYFIHPFWTFNPSFNFHGTQVNDFFLLSLLYSEIDMNANGGAGAVINANQLIIQDSLRCSSTCLTQHANGRDWWLVIPHHNKNIYHTYLIDPKGFTQYPDQVLGVPYPYDWGSSKEAYFSEDGSKLVVTCPQRYMLMDFDRCTGTLSNYIEISGLCSWYSWEQAVFAGHLQFYSALSSNNRFFYIMNLNGIDLDNPTGDENISRNKLYQYDLQATDVTASRQTIMSYSTTSGGVGPPHLTPNGLMLLGYGYPPGTSSADFKMLKKPNLLGMSSEPTSLPYNKHYGGGYSYSYLPNYRLGYLPGSSCDTLQHVGIAAAIQEATQIKIQPNPTADKVQISASAAMQELSLYNAMGQLVYTGASKGKETELSLAAYPQGVYFLVIKTRDNAIFTEKIVKL